MQGDFLRKTWNDHIYSSNIIVRCDLGFPILKEVIKCFSESFYEHVRNLNNVNIAGLRIYNPLLHCDRKRQQLEQSSLYNFFFVVQFYYSSHTFYNLLPCLRHLHFFVLNVKVTRLSLHIYRVQSLWSDSCTWLSYLQAYIIIVKQELCFWM